MRVLVAGATGAIGRRVVPRLIAAAHEVTGITRSPERAAQLQELGAHAAICDVYDRPRLADAVRRAAPEVVVHLLTDLPARFRPRTDLTSNDRLRREGTGNLVAAAGAAGARRLLAESIAFAYAPAGRVPKREDDALWLDGPGSYADSVRAVAELERQVLQAPGIEGLVLRFGWLYGPGTWYAPDGSIAQDLRRRMYPVVGAGSGEWSFVHVDDAAAAVAAGVASPVTGVLNIVDDEPAPLSAWVPALAQAVGAPRPWRVPPWLARLVAGREAVELTQRLVGASNARACAALDWTLRYPSWRQGFRAFATDG